LLTYTYFDSTVVRDSADKEIASADTVFGLLSP
jgi:hypothetical protein